MHGAQGGLVALRVDLDMMDPDILPEAQAHHIQVITTITEGTGQLDKHCWYMRQDLLLYCNLSSQHGRGFSEELFGILPFLVPKSFGSSFTIPSVTVTVQSLLYLSSSPCGFSHIHWRERTNFVHTGHVVHIISLPQVEGQLEDRRTTSS